MNVFLTKINQLSSTAKYYLRLKFESLIFIFVYYLVFVISGPLNNLNLEKITFGFFLISYFGFLISYKIFGLLNERLKYTTVESFVRVLVGCAAISALIGVQTYVVFGVFSFWMMFFFIILHANLLVISRILSRQIVRNLNNFQKQKVIVFGVSDAAIDFVNATSFSKKYKVIGFLADENVKRNDSLIGLPVLDLKGFPIFVKKTNVDLVVLIEDDIDKSESQYLIKYFDELSISISYAPTIDKAFDYEIQLKSVSPEELLGRPPIIYDDPKIINHITDKEILISGAGGSIGSEICRQALKYKPKKIVLFDVSEYALYALREELFKNGDISGMQTELIYVLGSVSNNEDIREVLSNHNIEIIYHAAAYKHVPMLEENIIAGVKNNILGTYNLANLAFKSKVKKFILISTDKAVRPTNIMGATKRMAELICQYIFQHSDTVFSMVRFGNVLGSSGSVIPKFKDQIKSGGPVTVTDKDITRYFMSIPEAANLVITAGAMAEGGEVFLLDMGDSVKILDLAKSMIRLHGLTPVIETKEKKIKLDFGEVLIEFSGLRPGEKLYEELLVDSVAEKTPNPKIFKAVDKSVELSIIKNALNKINDLLVSNDVSGLKSLLESLPLDYKQANTPENSINSSNFHKVTQINKAANLNLNKEKNFAFFPLNNIVSFVLHKYFWFSRGMTLGVRVAVFNENNEVLLVKHSYIRGWHMPGGGVDRGETVRAAAKREIFEETGIKNLDIDDGHKVYLNSDISERDHIIFFTAKTSQSLNFNKNFEIVDAKFFSLDKLPNDIEIGALRRLKEHQNNTHIQNNPFSKW